jgi:hypothetical protein
MRVVNGAFAVRRRCTSKGRALTPALSRKWERGHAAGPIPRPSAQANAITQVTEPCSRKS